MATLASRQVLSARRRISFTSFFDRETYIENLALAITTLPYREILLYQSFQDDGFELPGIRPFTDLNHIHEMALFRQLDMLGAFGEFSEWMTSEELSSVGIWGLLRWEGKFIR